MTFNEAIALQPQWVQIWLNILFAGAFVLPLGLLIWRQSRVAGVITLVSSALAGFATFWLYDQFGYVRLLGLGHIVVWTPLLIWLLARTGAGDFPVLPLWITRMVISIIAISLAFDYVDLLRYIGGNRAPF
jgi:hypothetical protein